MFSEDETRENDNFFSLAAAQPGTGREPLRVSRCRNQGPTPPDPTEIPQYSHCTKQREEKVWGRKLFFLTDRNLSQIEAKSRCVANFPQMTSRNTP